MYSSNLKNHPRINMMRIADLRSNPKNPRTHSEKQILLLAGSIERWGFLVPIIIDEKGMIVAGHARYLAATHLQLEYAPVIEAQFVSESDRRAFTLAENKLSELGGWNPEQLLEELNYLFDNSYDLDITGFTLTDLNFSIGDAAEPDTPEEIELPDPMAAAVSRTGDLWSIGAHRLFCGNSLDAASYDALLGSQRAGMVFADGPYNVRIKGHVSGSASAREFQMASGEMSKPEFTLFLRKYMQCCAMFSEDGSIHYHFMDFRHMREILDAGEGVYGPLKQLVVWDKGSGSMGSFYRAQHELIFIWKSGKAPHINNFGLGDKGRYRTNIWAYKGANTFSKDRKRNLSDHPTVKSLALVMDAILDCSNKGDIVLDPFSGSGTTLLAAHKTGRIGAAIEIDPLYVDTALRRLRDATGITPPTATAVPLTRSPPIASRTWRNKMSHKNKDDDRDDVDAVSDTPENVSQPEDPDDVGYRKPPKEHRFKPGQSGNPKGRAKGTRGLKSDLRDELRSKASVTENGKTRKLTKQQIILKTLVAKAAKGDVRAIEKSLALIANVFGVEDERTETAALTLREQSILDNFLMGNGEPIDPKASEEPETDAGGNGSGNNHDDRNAAAAEEDE